MDARVADHKSGHRSHVLRYTLPVATDIESKKYIEQMQKLVAKYAIDEMPHHLTSPFFMEAMRACDLYELGVPFDICSLKDLARKIALEHHYMQRSIAQSDMHLLHPASRRALTQSSNFAQYASDALEKQRQEYRTITDEIATIYKIREMTPSISNEFFSHIARAHATRNYDIARLFEAAQAAEMKSDYKSDYTSDYKSDRGKRRDCNREDTIYEAVEISDDAEFAINY